MEIFCAKDRRSVVVQREVGLDVPSTAAGLRAAARQDADVLMVGELEDGETAELAVAAAESGQLGAGGRRRPRAPPGAVDRLMALWDPARRGRPRGARLDAVPCAACSFRRLVTTPERQGRTASAELLHAVPRRASSHRSPAGVVRKP